MPSHRIELHTFSLQVLEEINKVCNNERQYPHLFLNFQESDPSHQTNICKKKCPHEGLNYGPSVYRTGALPLSYKMSKFETYFVQLFFSKWEMG